MTFMGGYRGMSGYWNEYGSFKAWYLSFPVRYIIGLEIDEIFTYVSMYGGVFHLAQRCDFFGPVF